VTVETVTKTYEAALPQPVPARLLRLASALTSKLERVLGHRRAMPLIVVVAVLGVGNSLWSGLGADDHIHRLSLRGSTTIAGLMRAPLDLFRFASPEYNRSLMEQGVFPWWSDPDVRLSFFRPITSFTHLLDHWLWPESAFMAHAQTVAWFVALVLGVGALYSRLVAPAWVAALALFFFALDDARGGPVSWIANRNALVAGAFSVWSLVCFVRSERDGWRPGWLLGPLLFALGLLAGEGAASILGYLFAYALFMASGTPRRRIVTLLPYLVLLVAWRLTSRALGYGSSGSGVYVDPLSEPFAFLVEVFVRLPILLLGQLAAPWSEIYNAAPLVVPGMQYVLLVLAAAVIGGTAYLLVPLWRERRVRFFCVGALIAGIAPCATFPSDRLLTWIAIGASAVLAELLAALLLALEQPASSRWRPRIALTAAASILMFHAVLGPVFLPIRSIGIESVRAVLERADHSLPQTPEIENETFVYVNPPGDPLASYIPIMRADTGGRLPRAQRWLASGTCEVAVERLDAHSLRVRPSAGFLQSPSEQMLRSPRRPLNVGESVQLGGFSARITALTSDGRPAEAVIRFERMLEDPSLRWFRWSGARYEPCRPPAIGERVVYPAVDLFKVAYGEG
jgi:hypothetical protein